MINALYNSFAGWLMGGTVAVVLFALLYYKAARVAASGNKGRMISYSVMPAVLLICSVFAATTAAGFAIPRIQAFVGSQPVAGVVQAGDTATKLLDYVLTSGVDSVRVQAAPMPPGTGVEDLLQSVSSYAPSSAVSPANESNATPVSEVNTAPEDGFYTVRRGDTMSSIAKAQFGDSNAYVELCRLNNMTLASCSNLRSGMKIRLPTTVAPPATQKWNAAIATWQQKPAPTNTPVVDFAPARNAQEQAAKDAERWNITFGGKP